MDMGTAMNSMKTLLHSDEEHRYGTYLTAGVVATKVGFLAGATAYHVMAGMSSIDTFSSGALTLHGHADKARDYAALLAFLVSALFAFCAYIEVPRLFAERSPGRNLAALNNTILLANIPAAYALGLALLARSIEWHLIILSAFAEAVIILCFVLRNQEASDALDRKNALKPYALTLGILLLSLSLQQIFRPLGSRGCPSQ